MSNASDFMTATHGSVISHTGTCETCGRESVALATSRLPDGSLRLNCADRFACFAKWQTQRKNRPTNS